MKAVQIRRYGGPEVLELADVPAPTPKAGEVSIAVRATSVNPVDWLIRDGAAKSFVRVKFPVILGCDLAGTIAEVGPDVSRFKVGDPVFAMMPHDWGAHAERVVLAQDLVVAIPDKLSMVEAAALPTAALTALRALRDKAKLQPGEHVLINGGSSSVGLAAIQIAKALGAGDVTAVCSGASAELVKRVGADHVVDYKVIEFTDGSAQYDIVFDCIGNKPYNTCGKVLRGRRVHATTVPGPKTFIRMFANPLFRTKVFGFLTTGSGENLGYVKQLVEAGKLQPVVDKVFPFSDVAAAQEYSKAGRAKGKIILEL